jgi:hypothetical protein
MYEYHTLNVYRIFTGEEITEHCKENKCRLISMFDMPTHHDRYHYVFESLEPVKKKKGEK